jgi:hypothetical protein
MKRYRNDPAVPNHLRKLVDSARGDDIDAGRRRRVAERLGILLPLAPSNNSAYPAQQTKSWVSAKSIALTAVALVGGASYATFSSSRPPPAPPAIVAPVTMQVAPPPPSVAAPPVAALTGVVLSEPPSARPDPTFQAVGATEAESTAESLPPSAPPPAVLSPAVPSMAVPSPAVPSMAVPSPAVPSMAVPSPAVPSMAVPSMAIEALPDRPADSPARPPHRPPPAAETKTEPGNLRIELATLDAVRRATEGGHASHALTLLDKYASKFPTGKLREEAAVLRVEALQASGDRTSAAALARRLLRDSPNSPYAVRIRAALESDSRE